MTFDTWLIFGILAAAAVLTAGLIRALQPWLVRYAMARPNARSSHATPTPQGGGVAIVITIAVFSAAWVAIGGLSLPLGPVVALVAAMLVLAATGAIDDVRPLPVLPRLGLQIGVAALLVSVLPDGARLVPLLPPSVEAVALTLALVWFINLTNFMDGIDWMTVVEVLPISITLGLLGLFGVVPQMTPLLPVILALIGAIVGFAPFNRHVARLFMGDVGSLPIGALVGWLLMVLALAGHWQAALILPLYYLADATITLFRRAIAGENIAQAHRSHFYQRAVQGGFSVPEVTSHVFGLNVVLAALGSAAVLAPHGYQRFVCLGLASFAVATVLAKFNQGQRA